MFSESIVLANINYVRFKKRQFSIQMIKKFKFFFNNIKFCTSSYTMNLTLIWVIHIKKEKQPLS